MASPYDLYVRDIAVGVYYEAAGHTAFYATLVGIGWIVTVFVDVVKQGFVAAGEGWFNFHIIVFKHFTIGLASVGRMAGGDATGLGPGACGADDKCNYGGKERD